MHHFNLPLSILGKNIIIEKATKAACDLCIETGGSCGHIDREPYYFMSCNTFKNSENS